MKYTVSFNGNSYEVEVEFAEPMLSDEFISLDAYRLPTEVESCPNDDSTSKTPDLNVATTSEECVTAPMPGTILKINVSVGQTVKKDQVLFVLEAMKMENEIPAHKDGVVKQILTNKGSTVEANTPLLILG